MSAAIEKMEVVQKKFDVSKRVVKDAFARFDNKRLAVLYTGGKDSTLVLYIIKETCRELHLPMPLCCCIDSGTVLSDIREFIERIAKEWNIPNMLHVRNDDVFRAAGGILGASVKVADLDERNRAEIARLGYDEDEFIYEPESFVSNYLMRTATLNRFLGNHEIQALFEGVRCDEQSSADEEYFRPREGNQFSPKHFRVHPILHFTERDVWDAHFLFEIPCCRLYRLGYRSIGAGAAIGGSGGVPAWEQDLENTVANGGRRQDKECLVKRLRDLGYM